MSNTITSDISPEYIDTMNQILRLYKESADGNNPKIEIPVLAQARSIQDWLEDPISQKNDFTIFARMFELVLEGHFTKISKSSTFQGMLLQCPEVLETPIHFLPFEKEDTTGGFYCFTSKSIGIKFNIESFHQDSKYSGLFEPVTYQHGIFMIHELRHAFHDKNKHIETKVGTSNAEDTLALEFIKEAEVFAFQATICWELKELGDNEYWQEFSLNAHKIAKAFENSITQDPDALQSGAAQTAAFNAFFHDISKINFYTDKIIKDYTEGQRLPTLQKREEKPPKDWHFSPPFLETDNQDSIKPDEINSEQRNTENTSSPLQQDWGDSTLEEPIYGLMPFLGKDSSLEIRPDYLKTQDIPSSTNYYIQNVKGQDLLRLRNAVVDSIIKSETQQNTYDSPYRHKP